MIAGAQKGIELVHENDARGQLFGQRKGGSNELVALAKPLVHDFGEFDLKHKTTFLKSKLEQDQRQTESNPTGLV